MTEFVRTVTSGNSRSYRSLYRDIAILLTLFLGFSLWVFWSTSLESSLVAGQMQEIRTIQSIGSGKLDGAKGIAVDKRGFMYVTDSRNDRVVVFSSTGQPSKTIGEEKEESEILLKYPSGITISGKKVYVGSYGTGQIVVFDTGGRLVDRLPRSEDRGRLQSVYPLVMTSDSKGNIYVADGKTSQIIVFDAEGRLQLIFGEPGYGQGQLRHVNGLAVDEEKRRLIVMDSGNLRIAFFNLDGKFLYQRIYQNNTENALAAPRGIAYSDKLKRIYIVDPLLDQLLAVDDKGNILGRNSEGSLKYPQAVTLSPEGYLYIANRESGSIVVIYP